MQGSVNVKNLQSFWRFCGSANTHQSLKLTQCLELFYQQVKLLRRLTATLLPVEWNENTCREVLPKQIKSFWVLKGVHCKKETSRMTGQMRDWKETFCHKGNKGDSSWTVEDWCAFLWLIQQQIHLICVCFLGQTELHCPEPLETLM